MFSTCFPSFDKRKKGKHFEGKGNKSSATLGFLRLLMAVKGFKSDQGRLATAKVSAKLGGGHIDIFVSKGSNKQNKKAVAHSSFSSIILPTPHIPTPSPSIVFSKALRKSHDRS